MSLLEICELYNSGDLPEEFSKISLTELVNLADEEESAVLDSTGTTTGTIAKKFTLREDIPNSNFTNVPLVLFRGDENNEATLSLVCGLYDEEFEKLGKHEDLDVKVETTDGLKKFVRVEIDIDFPKDEKLSRKVSGLAESGSEFLCTYCSSSRNACINHLILVMLG